MEQNYLAHYGVKGMRWGVRRDRKSKNRRTPSEDSATVARIRKKSVSEMSNQELQTANKRMELERNYSNLNKKTKAGAKIVAGIVATAATVVALDKAISSFSKVGKKYTTQAVDKVGNQLTRELAKGLAKPFN